MLGDSFEEELEAALEAKTEALKAAVLKKARKALLYISGEAKQILR